jgi:hypothetical protein
MDNINIDTDNIDNIDKYYSTVDKNVINNLCTDNNIKNLIHLSAKTDINPFNKCKKKWNLKSKNKLLKECENIKKKEFKEIYSRLNNLSKLGNNNIDDLKNIYKKSENKMDTLHKLINCINNINLSSQDSTINIVENILEHKKSNRSKQLQEQPQEQLRELQEHLHEQRELQEHLHEQRELQKQEQQRELQKQEQQRELQKQEQQRELQKQEQLRELQKQEQQRELQKQEQQRELQKQEQQRELQKQEQQRELQKQEQLRELQKQEQLRELQKQEQEQEQEQQPKINKQISKNTRKIKTTYIVDHDKKSKSNIVSFDIVDVINKPIKKDDKIIKLSFVNNLHIQSENSDNYLECFSNY